MKIERHENEVDKMTVLRAVSATNRNRFLGLMGAKPNICLKNYDGGLSAGCNHRKNLTRIKSVPVTMRKICL